MKYGLECIKLYRGTPDFQGFFFLQERVKNILVTEHPGHGPFVSMRRHTRLFPHTQDFERRQIGHSGTHPSFPSSQCMTWYGSPRRLVGLSHSGDQVLDTERRRVSHGLCIHSLPTDLSPRERLDRLDPGNEVELF